MTGNPCNQCDDAQKWECNKANNCLFGIKTIDVSPIPPLSKDDRGWEQGFQDGQTSALTDLNLLEAKIRNEVLEEMVKLSMMIEEEETDRWNKMGRIKNDAYINGSHSGYGHALRDMRQWIDRIKMANGRVKV